MLHLSEEKYKEINSIALQIAQLKRGRRKYLKTYAAELQRLVWTFSSYAKKSPKEYRIIYILRKNLGTKKYSDMSDDINILTVSKNDTVRETEKSIIVEKNISKTIIPKNKIIAYIW